MREISSLNRWLIRLFILMMLGVGAALLPSLNAPRADAAGKGRHIGYGISVVPFVPSRPDLLDTMGMDWVKIYSTSQLGNYPGQHVLYRVDVPGDPIDY